MGDFFFNLKKQKTNKPCFNQSGAKTKSISSSRPRKPDVQTNSHSYPHGALFPCPQFPSAFPGLCWDDGCHVLLPHDEEKETCWQQQELPNAFLKDLEGEKRHTEITGPWIIDQWLGHSKPPKTWFKSKLFLMVSGARGKRVRIVWSERGSHRTILLPSFVPLSHFSWCVCSPGGGKRPREKKGHEHAWVVQASSHTKFIISSSNPEIKVGGTKSFRAESLVLGAQWFTPPSQDSKLKPQAGQKKDHFGNKIELTIIICGFHACKFAYLLKCICDHRTVTHGHAQSCKSSDSSKARVSPWGPKPGFASLLWLWC